MRNNFLIKIAPVILVINLPIIIGLLLKLNLLIVLALSLTLSFLAIFFIYRLFTPLKKIALRAYQIAVGNTNQVAPNTEDETQLLTKSLDLISKSQTQTYAKIAYERDILASDKNKLATIISSIPEAVIVLDLHKQVILANPAAEKITGFKQSEMYKRQIDELIKLLDKENIPISADEYCPVNLEKPGGQSNYASLEPITLGGKGYTKAKVKLSANTISSDIKSDLGCILLFHEVSQETSLQSMQVDFVSMASHELRTPLTSIIGYLNVLIDEGKDKFDTEQKDFLYRVLAGAKQLSNLVSNLLNVSKVERGAISINTQPLEYYKLLSQVVDENRLQASQKNISLGLVDTDPSIPQVQADTVRITEVLNNLISNAVNYTAKGGSISVSAKVQNQDVITSISDTGKGIPAEAIPHLFTKFFRVSSTEDTSSNSKGTGLGLYLSKSIIELHHGKIWVQSKVSQGTTFYFTLPISQIQTIEAHNSLDSLHLAPPKTLTNLHS